MNIRIIITGTTNVNSTTNEGYGESIPNEWMNTYFTYFSNKVSMEV